jgi:hypothetical protein
MTRLSILFALMLTIVAGAMAQTAQVSETLTPAPSALTFSQVATAAKTYLRDSAEFPLSMQVSMMAVDGSGRTIKKDRAKGRYDFHGYNMRSEHASGSMQVQTEGFFHSPRGMLPTVWNSFVASILPAHALATKAEEKYAFEAAGSAAGGQLVTAIMIPLSGTCSEFKWSIKNGVPERFCGTSKLELQKDDLSLQHLSFDSSGLPLATEVKPFGRCQLLRYHAEVEFQKVMLPDDPKPFLVPKHVEVTVETDKGQLIMTSDFAPRK